MIISLFPRNGGGDSGVRLADVTGATISIDKTSATLTWSDPNDVTLDGATLAAWAGTKVVRKVGSAPADVEDGVLIVNSQTRNQYASSGFEDTGLSYDTTYYYRFFPYTPAEYYTAGSSVSGTPERDSIDVPTVSAQLTYDGTEQTQTFDDYDSTKMSATGITATDSGDYEATFTPLYDYEWDDGTRVGKTVAWSIDKLALTAPTVSGDFTYDGTQKSATITAYDSTYITVTGDTATNAGTHTVTMSLEDISNTEWSDGTTADKFDTWSIVKMSLTVPTVSGSYTYDGDEKSASITAYDSDYIQVVSGDTGTNAGTYTVTFRLNDTSNTQWSDSSVSDKTGIWSIAKATFTATVSISGYTYAGTKSTPSVSTNPGGGAVTYYGRATSNGTSTVWSSVTATTYNAGTRYCYAIVAATENYESCTTAEASFSIAKASFTATVSVDGYSYAGTKTSPSVSSNPGNGSVTYYGRATENGAATEWVNVTNTTYDAGTRYCYAVIAATTNYNGYTTPNASFTIAKGTFSSSVSISGYTYGGTKSSPSVSNNPGSGSVTYYGRSTTSGNGTAWSSVTSTTYDAGTRYCYAVIAETTNYNSVTTGNTSFTIAEADGAVTLSTDSVELDASHLTATVTASNATGTVSASSNDTSVATVTVSGSQITISSVNGTNGSATITVSVAASTNYKATSKTVSVTASFVSDLNSASWATISQISAAGTASSYWAVGDCKEITLNGDIGAGLTLTNEKKCVFILGFNHNSSVEGSGISFGCFKTAVSGGTDVALCDDAYNTSAGYSGEKKFAMNHWGSNSSPYNTNYGGWAACDMRYDILGSTNQAPNPYGSTKTTGATGSNPTSTCATSPVANTLMAALPSDLRAVMKPITKYTDNKGNSSNVSGNVTATIDYLPLLSEYEVQGARSYANQYERNSQAQYQYYKNGNSKVKKNNTASGSAVYWWVRSARSTGAHSFCSVGTDGSASADGSRFSCGVAPAFLI